MSLSNIVKPNLDLFLWDFFFHAEDSGTKIFWNLERIIKDYTWSFAIIKRALLQYILPKTSLVTLNWQFMYCQKRWKFVYILAKQRKTPFNLTNFLTKNCQNSQFATLRFSSILIPLEDIWTPGRSWFSWFSKGSFSFKKYAFFIVVKSFTSQCAKQCFE